MLSINNIDFTHCVEKDNYEIVDASTKPNWVRNSITGKLYREKTGNNGAVIRYHVIGFYLNDELYETLKFIYDARELISFISDKTAGTVTAYIKDDEFRAKRITTDWYEVVITIEEVQKIK